MNTEVWRDIVGYEGYQVSNYGNVRSLDRYVNNNSGKSQKNGVLLKKHYKDEYPYFYLCKNGKKKFLSSHRLAAIAFIPNPNNLPEINHKDEKKWRVFIYVNPDGTIDPDKSNLEWCSREYNMHYGTAIRRASEKRTNGIRSRKVLQYDKNDNYIAEYPSMGELKRRFGYNQGAISSCCNGKCKSAYGYKWRYA